MLSIHGQMFGLFYPELPDKVFKLGKPKIQLLENRELYCINTTFNDIFIPIDINIMEVREMNVLSWQIFQFTAFVS